MNLFLLVIFILNGGEYGSVIFILNGSEYIMDDDK
jgi:hypothetical protein